MQMPGNLIAVFVLENCSIIRCQKSTSPLNSSLVPETIPPIKLPVNVDAVTFPSESTIEHSQSPISSPS